MSDLASEPFRRGSFCRAFPALLQAVVAEIDLNRRQPPGGRQPFSCSTSPFGPDRKRPASGPVEVFNPNDERDRKLLIARRGRGFGDRHGHSSVDGYNRGEEASARCWPKACG